MVRLHRGRLVMSDLQVRDRVQAILTLADKIADVPPGDWKVGASFACNAGESSAWVTADFETVAEAKAVAAFIAACNAFPDVATALLEALDTIDSQAQRLVAVGTVLMDGTTRHDAECGCPACEVLALLREPFPALNGGNE